MPGSDNMFTTDDLFDADDLLSLSDHVVAQWRSNETGPWSALAGDVDWSCRDTAIHLVDTVYAPAMFLASRRQHAYPPFEPLEFEKGSTIADICDGLVTARNLLLAVVAAADPNDTAIIFRWPAKTVATPEQFLARGGHELIIHAYDVAMGLGLEFEPPADMCRRLRDQIRGWPNPHPEPDGGWVDTDDPWADLLERAGRSRR